MRIFCSKIAIILILFSCKVKSQETKTTIKMKDKEVHEATLGAGCFWCIEAAFDALKGVKVAESGYSGGFTSKPTYKEICTGKSGHAEVVRILYYPNIISFKDLLEVFWTMHDPTTLNRQGADVGTQYRSVIFYHNEQQKKQAEEYKKELGLANIWGSPIVTEISPLINYFTAENYHQEYYSLNKTQPYCNMVITPKMKKFRKVFEKRLKSDL